MNRSHLLRFALVLVVCSLCSVPVMAEEIPRRHDGKPDLSGTYDIATLTPMQRNPKYGDTLTLTADEAAAIEKYWAENLAQDYEPSDPNRKAPPKGGVEVYAKEFSGAAGGVGGYNAGFVDLGDSTFQIEGKFRTSILIDPVDGRFPKLSEEGMARAKEGAIFRHFGPAI